MTRTEAIAFLTRDGNLRVPCSRYGHDSLSCAKVAVKVEAILAAETGEETTEESLDYVMGLVVNDHDDPEYLLRNYG